MGQEKQISYSYYHKCSSEIVFCYLIWIKETKMSSGNINLIIFESKDIIKQQKMKLSIEFIRKSFNKSTTQWFLTKIIDKKD